MVRVPSRALHLLASDSVATRAFTCHCLFWHAWHACPGSCRSYSKIGGIWSRGNKNHFTRAIACRRVPPRGGNGGTVRDTVAPTRQRLKTGLIDRLPAVRCSCRRYRNEVRSCWDVYCTGQDPTGKVGSARRMRYRARVAVIQAVKEICCDLYKSRVGQGQD